MDEQTLFSQPLTVVQSSLSLGGFLQWLALIGSCISCPREPKTGLGAPGAMSQVLEREGHLPACILVNRAGDAIGVLCCRAAH